MQTDYTLEKLLSEIEINEINVDIEKIKEAYDLAAQSHKGQKRSSGHDFITHTVATAINIVNLKLDEDTIIAGLLHDVLEDTPTTQEIIHKKFGKTVTLLVEGVSNLDKLKYRGNYYYIENLRKMFVAMAKDLRVILIKFADRLHNLQTLEHLSHERQQRIATEALEIFAPIAHRLGLGELKGNLEDLAFKYVYPEDFDKVNKIAISLYKEKNKSLKLMKDSLKEILTEKKISYIEIYDRVKRLYSLYKKLKKRDLTKVYDLIALRIIVPTIADCYTCLGIIHCHYTPLKGRIKDYIAQPKPNGYQSLHTTVFSEDGELVEVQIRTPLMNERAQFGVAAHWTYKKNKSLSKNNEFSWVKELAVLARKLKKDPQYIEDLKLDIFKNRIYVFTPVGDVIELPEEATPIDFAYHIHTYIGNKCVNSRINGQIASLSTKLKNGDIVEIIKDKNRKAPDVAWLKIVKTHSAKMKIKNAINKNKRSQIFKFKK